MADASVRPARTAEAAEIARVQLVTWRTAYAGLLPRELPEPTEVSALWRAAIEAPPGPAYHVLVALENETLVGFAALEPDPEEASAGVVTGLIVEPRWGRRGHGSRLLAASVDHARTDGRRLLRTWVLERDRAAGDFYASAGWERDGWVRILEPDGAAVREIRWHTALTED